MTATRGTARSTGIKIGAVALAVALHAGGVALVMTEEPVMIEGGGSQDAQFGNSFSDMVAGTLTAEETSDTIAPEQTPDTVTEAEPDPIEPIAADPVEAPTPAEPIAPDVAEPAPEVPPEEIANPTAEVAEAEAEPESLSVALPEVNDGAMAVQPEPVTPVTVPPEVLTAAPEAAEVAPPEPITAEPVAPQDTVAAINPDSSVPQLSKRPVRRDPALEKPEPKPEPRPQRQAQPKPTNRGNSNQAAKQGTTRGTAEKADTRQGAGNAARSAGNAAVSNYPGLVNRHLSRVRKPSLSRRGTVRVTFSIAASGGLAGVSISGSSGSAALDKAAATMIRRAAPFPRPPAGAQRTFTVPIRFN